jgi:alpha-N-acetylglucosamine transferase
MRLLRASCLLPMIAFLVGALVILLFYSLPSNFSAATKLKHSLSFYIPSYSFKSSASQRAAVGAFDLAAVKKNRRYAITSSVQTASFTGLALNLAYSIQKHNDLEALDAELILLVRTEGVDGVSAENITRLEKVGWKVQVAEELEFDQVDTSAIRSWHRHNLNKLHIWTWTQYEKIIFIDADVLCKGSFAELFKVPGDIAASPDVWWDVLVDNKFNSGVLVIRPNLEEFRSLFKAVSDPNMHSPNDADQAFLNSYYSFRYFGLPYKYNFNLVMFDSFEDQWNMLWDEAVFVHFTTRKPHPYDHCERTCDQWEVLSWYSMIYQEMLDFYGFTDLPVLG